MIQLTSRSWKAFYCPSEKGAFDRSLPATKGNYNLARCNILYIQSVSGTYCFKKDLVAFFGSCVGFLNDGDVYMANRFLVTVLV